MKLLKLIKLIKPESLARSRKRIRNDLEQSANDMIFSNIIKDGTEGYKRERNIYG